MTAALAEGKTPALTLSFVDEQGRPRCGEWVVIPRDVIARGLSHDFEHRLDGDPQLFAPRLLAVRG